jgi:hypothetical protein
MEHKLEEFLAAKRHKRRGATRQAATKATEPPISRMTQIKRLFNAKTQRRKDAKTEMTLCAFAPSRLCVKYPRAIQSKILAGMNDSSTLHCKKMKPFLREGLLSSIPQSKPVQLNEMRIL